MAELAQIPKVREFMESAITEDATKRLELQRQLDRVANARANTNIVTWAVSSVFVAAMGPFANAVFQAGKEKYFATALGLSAAAFFISVVWKVTLHRALLHLELQEAVTSDLEDELWIDPRFRVTFRHPRYLEEGFRSGFKAKPTLRTAASVAVAAWFVAMVLFFALFVTR